MSEGPRRERLSSAYPESFIDRVEARRQVWAPYYTLHKIMAGLLDSHVYCVNRQALEVLEGMARWCKGRCDKLSEEQMQQMLNATEQGGMNDVLAGLYAITGNPDHLALSRRFVERAYNDPLAAGRDQLKGQHVNSFIPNMIGTARQYEVTGNPEDRKIAEFFWHQVVGHRSYLHRRHEQRRALADRTRPTGDRTRRPHAGDLLHLQPAQAHPAPVLLGATGWSNGLLRAGPLQQHPEHAGLQDGHDDVLRHARPRSLEVLLNTPADSFWCCTGTGMENHANTATRSTLTMTPASS